MLKLMEEVGEIAAALARKDIDEVMDGIGDVGVVINIPLRKSVQVSRNVWSWHITKSKTVKAKWSMEFL